MRPVRAPWSLLPILEAYLVVARELASTSGPVEEKEFLQACLRRGEAARTEGLLVTEESVSTAMFAPAVALARNLGLISEEAALEDREEFARRVQALRDLAAAIGERETAPVLSPA